MEENTNKTMLGTISQIIKTLILPLSGIVVPLVVLYFNADANKDTRETLQWVIIVVTSLLALGAIADSVLNIIESTISIKLSESEKNVNSSQKQSSKFLATNINSIQKELKKLWNCKKPYKNLLYKNLQISFRKSNSSNRKGCKDRNLTWRLKRINKEDIHGLITKTDIICTTLYDLQRTLLEMGEYKIRETVGKIILKYSNNVKHLAAANIDFIGWTYMLSGTDAKAKKGEAYIKKGIELLKFYYKEEKDNEILMQLARAHRHLGTTRYVTRKTHSSEKSENIKNHLRKSDIYMCLYCDKSKSYDIPDKIESENDLSNYVNDDSLINEYIKIEEDFLQWNDYKKIYYAIFNKKFTITDVRNYRDLEKDDVEKEIKKLDESLKRMLTGVIFNKCLCYFYDAVNFKNNKKHVFDEKNLKKIKKILQDKMFEHENVDDHRKIKVKSLLTDINFTLIHFSDDKNNENNVSEINDNLADIEYILKNNIYFDEGMELYLEQKFEKLCYDIGHLNDKK